MGDLFDGFDVFIFLVFELLLFGLEFGYLSLEFLVALSRVVEFHFYHFDVIPRLLEFDVELCYLFIEGGNLLEQLCVRLLGDGGQLFPFPLVQLLDDLPVLVILLCELADLTVFAGELLFVVGFHLQHQLR